MNEKTWVEHRNCWEQGSHRVYPLDDGNGGFVISSYGFWRPGVYETERAAWMAIELDDAILARLRDTAIAESHGLITEAAFVSVRHKKNETPPDDDVTQGR